MVQPIDFRWCSLASDEAEAKKDIGVNSRSSIIHNLTSLFMHYSQSKFPCRVSSGEGVVFIKIKRNLYGRKRRRGK